MKPILSGFLSFLLALALAVPSPAWALRPSQAEAASGLEEIRGALVAPAPESAGLEELTPENLIDGWDALGAEDQVRLAQELSEVADSETLARWVENARNPVVPPRTLYELLAASLHTPESEVQQKLEALPSSAWQPPDTFDIGESETVAEPSAAEIKELLESTVIMVAAGGGGARFKKSLPQAFRDQLERRDRLEKPTVMIGPSGLSPTVRTILEVAELARRVGARGVQVIVVDAPDSSRAVHHDVEQGTSGVDPGMVRISMTEQATVPSFDPVTHKLLVTRDDDGSPRLLRNPDGTYGVFTAAYRKAQGLGVAEGRGCLILYGDDPRLNAAPFITRALHQRKVRGLDAAAVTTPKLTPTVPVGGTRADVVVDGLRIPLIVEKAERTPDPAKGIAGLPVLNEVEAAETAKGQDPFGFNTGVLVLSPDAARLAGETQRLIRYADRDRDDVPGGKRRNLETFLTHIVTLVGAAGMKVGDLRVDSNQYQGAKDWPKVAAGSVEMDRKSRETLRGLPGGSAESVSVSEECRLDLLPGFAGFRIEGEGRLDLAGNAGYILSPKGLSRVAVTELIDVSWQEPDPANPTQEIIRTARQPIFADPEQAELLLPANPDGTITLSQPYSSTAGLEEEQEEIAEPVAGGAATVPVQVNRFSQTGENPFPDFPLAEPGRSAQLEIFVVDAVRIHAREANQGKVQEMVARAQEENAFKDIPVDVSSMESIQPFSIVVLDGDAAPEGLGDKVAVVDLGKLESPSLSALLTEALRQWTGRTIGEVFLIRRLNDGRLAIYV